MEVDKQSTDDRVEVVLARYPRAVERATELCGGTMTVKQRRGLAAFLLDVESHTEPVPFSLTVKMPGAESCEVRAIVAFPVVSLPFIPISAGYVKDLD